ncbi:MAG TPA: nucleoside diphosphate kinase regulator [Bdellovibrionales bacterium]|nr:nucleoside diphosphate kinase regulator [Bdellovibrionales bacterium]
MVGFAKSEAGELLEEELARASIVPDDELPSDVVSMNSEITYQDLETGAEQTVTLVYPQEANSAENKISILAPIGSALIGLRVGGVIKWPIPKGKIKEIKVIRVRSLAALQS